MLDLGELDDLDDCTVESESVSLASDVEVVAEVAVPRPKPKPTIDGYFVSPLVGIS